MNNIDLEVYIGEAFKPHVQLADIADPGTIIVLARHEASPRRPLIGYLQLVAREDHVELKRLYVDVSQRGGGFAASLMEDVRNACRGLGLERFRLTVWTKNPRPIAFYRKMGFAVIASETFVVGEAAQIDRVMQAFVLPLPTSP